MLLKVLDHVVDANVSSNDAAKETKKEDKAVSDKAISIPGKKVKALTHSIKDRDLLSDTSYLPRSCQ